MYACMRLYLCCEMHDCVNVFRFQYEINEIGTANVTFNKLNKNYLI